MLWLPTLCFEVWCRVQGFNPIHKLDDRVLQRGLERNMEQLMFCRVVRILDFPCFRREVVIICTAISDALPLLSVPVFLALQVLVTIAVFFYTAEQEFDGPCKDKMATVPDAIYYVSFFLIGEWPLADFSFPGRMLCIVTCLFAMMMVAIPTGIIMEAVQSRLMSELVLSKGLDELDQVRREEDEENDRDAEEEVENDEAQQPQPKRKVDNDEAQQP